MAHNLSDAQTSMSECRRIPQGIEIHEYGLKIAKVPNNTG
jgi:hypothetical protein